MDDLAIVPPFLLERVVFAAASLSFFFHLALGAQNTSTVSPLLTSCAQKRTATPVTTGLGTCCVFGAKRR